MFSHFSYESARIGHLENKTHETSDFNQKGAKIKLFNTYFKKKR